MSVYMPINLQENMDEFISVLSEITSISLEYQDYNLVVAGDFNVDLHSGDERCGVLRAWARDLDVSCPAMAPDAPRRTTYTGPNGNTSMLDYVFVNDNIYINISNWEVMDTGDNLSDHDPKIVRFKQLTEYIPSSESFISKPMWHKASTVQKEQYRIKLDELLQNVTINNEAVSCKDINCINHREDFVTMLDNIREACVTAALATIPHSKQQSHGTPGWNALVRQKRSDAMFWHNRWKEAGRPRDGWICEMRRRTRFRYHMAVKDAKKEKDNILKGQAAKSLCNKDSKLFWKNISKLKKCDNLVSAVFDGKRGSDACDAFREKYKSLFNSNPSSNLQTTEKEINEGIRDKCCNNLSNNDKNNHLHSIDKYMVKNAIGKLKHGQYDDNSEIMSDGVIYGTDRLFTLLALLLTMMLRHGYDSDLFTKVTIKPLPKDKKKSLANSDNYRGIAPNGAIPKIFDYILLSHFPNIFLTSDEQFAYKSNFSTTMCTFMVLETIEYYKNKGSSVYISLLDSSKAFDYLKYDILFNKLLKKNLCPLVIRMLFNIYSQSKYRILWNGSVSNYFNIQNGVKQGAVLSPILYTLYVEKLIEDVKMSKKGCFIGNTCAAIFIYADDVILLTPSRSAMQYLLNICNEFSIFTGILFNYSKCKIIIINKLIDCIYAPLTLNSIPLSVVDSEKHLGHLLQSSGDMINFESVIFDIRSKCNCILRVFKMLNTNSKCALFNHFCNTFYGCQVIDVTSKQFNNIATNWRKSARYVLNLSPMTHSYLLPNIFGIPSADIQLYSRIICFVRNGLTHKSKLISFFFNHCIYNYDSYMCKNTYTICKTLNISVHDLKYKSPIWLKKKVKSLVPSSDWRCDMVRELLSCRDGEADCGLDSHEISYLLNDLCVN